jgi:hypothetical protein
VLPLQLGEVQRDVGVRRLDVDDPVPGEAAGRVAGAADDRRIGDRSGDLPPELPRRHRQLPRPPPLPRRRHARTHARLALADRLDRPNKKGKQVAPRRVSSFQELIREQILNQKALITLIN